MDPRVISNLSTFYSSYLNSSSAGSRSYKSRSPSHIPTSPSLSRRSILSPSPSSSLNNGITTSRRTLSPTRQNSSSRFSPTRSSSSRFSPTRQNSSSRFSPTRQNSSSRLSPTRNAEPSGRSPTRTNSSSRLSPSRQNGSSGQDGLPPSSPRIINELCVPKGRDTISGVSRRRSSGTTLPPALSSSVTNSAKYEKCYNDLLTRINNIKVDCVACPWIRD